MTIRHWPVVTITFAEPQDSESLGPLHSLAMEAGCLGVEEGSGKRAADLEQTGSVRYFFPEVSGTPEAARLGAEPLRSLVAGLAGEALPGVQVSVSVELLEDQDWGRNWRQYFRLIRVSDRIWCGPPWDAQLPADAPAGSVVVRIDPGQAFGTGTHETTQLCLRTLDSALPPGATVLDVGTGSGILCIAALLLGARHAVGMEVDDVCEENFLLNAGLNGCQDRMEYVSAGTIGALAQTEVFRRNRPDFILCNMLSNQFLPLLGALRALGARTVFSGFLLTETTEVTAAVRAAGFEPGPLQELREWGAFVCDPVGASLSGDGPQRGIKGMDHETLPIVPRPVVAERHAGTFDVTAETPLVVAGCAAIPAAARLFAEWLSAATGRAVSPGLSEQTPGAINLVLAENLADFGREAYDINVSADGVRVLAFALDGLVRAVQSLRQLFPVEFERQDGSAALPAALPFCNVADKPRYSWRGLSMDCCRHFVPKEYLLRLIDLLALYKFNVFHWHLTEDQGWRLQIDALPKLTEVAAWRGENRYGGFYTKDDVREVLAFAAERGIEVIPEIEMPGHSSAAIAAYPNLSCHGNPLPVSEKWGIHKDIYCAGKEDAFEFLRKVIDEVVELFPNKYIHIGGDEAPKDNWKACPHCQERIRAEGLKDENELQTWFIHRMQKYIESKGRHIIGWDEIAEGGIPENAILHHWRYDEHLRTALTTGHKVICSNVAYAYMDFPYYKFDDGTSDPPNKRAWMKANTTENARRYEFAPTDVTPEQAALIIGGEATMWLEFTPTLDEVDAQLWPRMCGLAEAFWSPKEKGTEEEFVARMATQEKRLTNLGVKIWRKAPR